MDTEDRDATIAKVLLNADQNSLRTIRFYSENGMGVYANTPDGRQQAIEAMRKAQRVFAPRYWVDVRTGLISEYWPVQMADEDLKNLTRRGDKA